MTVTTAPAATQSTSQQDSSIQRQSFSTTTADEASKFQTPKGHLQGGNKTTYVLTLRTDDSHQASMNKLRQIYFPPKLHKVDAHITLFHALPGPKLNAHILPAIKDIVATTAPYRIRATGPFRLKKGVGISVADDIEYATKGKHGRNMSRIIHAELRKKWSDWLSDQDATPVRVHYTVMNKVDQEEVVQRAMSQLEETFKQGKDTSNGHFDHGDKSLAPEDPEEGKEDVMGEPLQLEGEVQGLTLWRYDMSGRWLDPSDFPFEKQKITT